jgi:fumarate hydratase subunit beta
MLEHGCIYFGAVEGHAALLAQCVTSAEVIAYADLGAEAIHRQQVIDFPAIVVNDLHGGDQYEEGPRKWRRHHRTPDFCATPVEANRAVAGTRRQ